MASAGTGSRPRTGRAVAVVVAIIVLSLGSWVYLERMPASPAQPREAALPAPSAPMVPSAAPPAPTPGTEPSFDVVRVGPQGSAVIAGRAAPGAEVVVRDGSQEIARTQADRQGSFVAIPAAPLAPGGRALTLTSRENGNEVKGDGAVMVVVPPAAPAAETPAPLAVLVPGAGAPRVLQRGGGAVALGLDTVDYDDGGAIRFTGHAEARSTLRVYVDNTPAGDAVAGADGTWALTPQAATAPGLHTLRVDRLDAGGRVLSRVELPFQRAALPPAELAAGRIVVQPGQNLWRLARTAYGAGMRYTVIYLANRDQIRDPRRIYPGQAFAVPESAAATPR